MLMQYLYHKNSGRESITLKDSDYKYIVRVRRHKINEIIHLRNLKDNILYSYKIIDITKKEALLTLIDSRYLKIKAKKKLHIGWCIIEPKNIEKVLPILNEIGVSSISFIYCKRSQKSFRVDLKRLEKILLNSSQQSGRSSLMRLEIIDSLEEFLKLYPNTNLLNFSNNYILSKDIESIVIGCEGGFTQKEISLFNSKNIIGLNTPMILKSESAICAVTSNILL